MRAICTPALILLDQKFTDFSQIFTKLFLFFAILLM